MNTPRSAVAVVVTSALTVVALLISSPAYALASQSYSLSFTAGIGAYPRAAPAYDARTGVAVPEGTAIEGVCWVTGESLANPDGYTSDVWVRDASSQFWFEGWLDTGSYGVPVGLPDCATHDSSQAPAWGPNCDPGGAYISGSIVAETTDQGVRISIAPTDEAREAWGKAQGWESTVAMWHAIQNCVPNLYGSTADSVWQQLECHQRFATVRKPWSRDYATGDTYDLETWVDPLLWPNSATEALSHCLNEADPIKAMRFFAFTDGTTG